MKIDVLTLFPEMFAGPLDVSIVQRARASGRLDLRVHNLREDTHDRHKTVDDKPFGGGPGMVLKPEPLFEAVENLANDRTRVILMTPVGRPFDQAMARELAQCEHLLFICGSYEGVDERVRETLVDQGDCHRSLANRRSAAFDRPTADVTRGKQPGQVRLERQWLTRQRPSVKRAAR